MVKEIAVYLMGLMYMFTGTMHFLRPRPFVKIIPPFLPWPEALVYISGVAEILFGLLVFFEQTRSFAAWGLIILLIVVFPANIYMAMQFWQKQNPYLWLTLLRLPLQGVLIWWAFRYT